MANQLIKLDNDVIDIPDNDEDMDIDNNTNNNNHTDIGIVEGIGCCHVCGMMDATRHFGGFACRACGAFFRRSIVLTKEYSCRCALKRMIIEMSDKPYYCRIFCRACRLKRCLEIGMRPEAVRAAHFRRFHEERRATTKLTANNQVKQKQSPNEAALMEDREEQQDVKPDLSLLRASNIADANSSSYISLLNPLLPLKERMHRISTSTTILPLEFYNKFQTIESLIECRENILDQYTKFSDKSPSFWDRASEIRALEEHGFWKNPQLLDRLFQNLLLTVDVIKAIPIFSKLAIQDQKALLKDTVRKATQLLLSYFSLDVCSEAIVWSDGASIFELFAAMGRYYKSDLVQNAAYKIYINPMKIMNRVRPTNEEFLLLLTLLVAYPATGLSENARELLTAESEKYANVLMQFELNQLGQSTGVLRYMELQSLLWNCISSTYKARELYAYFDTVLDQGCFHNALLPVFRQFTLEGQNVY